MEMRRFSGQNRYQTENVDGEEIKQLVLYGRQEELDKMD